MIRCDQCTAGWVPNATGWRDLKPDVELVWVGSDAGARPNKRLEVRMGVFVGLDELLVEAWKARRFRYWVSDFRQSTDQRQRVELINRAGFKLIRK